MNDVFSGVVPLVHKSGISVPYSWWAGETASRFFTSIRDDKKIFGTKCPKCAKVYLPPRKTCPVCFKRNTEWVELSNGGEVVSFTVARRKLAAMRKDPPLVFALVKLDGADTALLHTIGEIDPEDVKIGMRVEAKFAEKRSGTIDDIEYFKPA